MIRQIINKLYLKYKDDNRKKYQFDMLQKVKSRIGREGKNTVNGFKITLSDENIENIIQDEINIISEIDLNDITSKTYRNKIKEQRKLLKSLLKCKTDVDTYNDKFDEEIKEYEKLHLIMTGGTIDMSGVLSREPSDFVYEILGTSKNRLEKWKINYEAKKLFERSPDSSNINSYHWRAIINEINKIITLKEEKLNIINKHGITRNSLNNEIKSGGVILTHGTDTLQVTSFVVAMALCGKKIDFPIIFTGSHSPSDVKGSDAELNLSHSFYLAKCGKLPPAVYVVIGGEIHLASRIAKVYTQPSKTRGRYFYSFPNAIGEIIGTDNPNLFINTNLYKSLTKNINCEDFIGVEFGLSKVELIVINNCPNIEIFESLNQRLKKNLDKYRTVVLDGSLKTFQQNKNILDKIIEKLYDISITGNTLLYFSDKNSYDIIKKVSKYKKYRINNIYYINEYIPISQARVKLAYITYVASMQNKEIEFIDRKFKENMVGEVYSYLNIPNWLKNKISIDNIKNDDEIIVTYPDISPDVYIDACDRLFSTHGKLFIFGFGDGHIPTVNRSIRDIFIEYIEEEFNIMIAIEKISNYQTIDELLNIITEIFINKNRDIVYKYFCNNYIIDKDELIKSIGYCVSKKIESDKKIKISQYLKKSRLIKIKNIDEVLDTIDFIVDKNERNKQIIDIMNYEENDYASYNNTIIEDYPHFMSLRLLKESIMSSDETMKCIGNFIDRGKKVFIKSQTVKGKVNLSLYENGQKLQVLGTIELEETEFHSRNKIFKRVRN